MQDNEALVAQARAHIDSIADAAPYEIANLIRTGMIADPRISLLVRLTNALAATLPKKGARYRTVRPAIDDPEVGELVQSKFGPASAAVWRIERTKRLPGRNGDIDLFVRSLSSHKGGTRRASSMLIVEAVE
jgi:hypothetical protein